MIKKVYVPLDGSQIADAAIQPGVQLARRAGAPLVLMAARWPDARDTMMRSYLDAHVAFLGGPVESWVISDHGPVEAIVEAAAEPGALVCMATHGRGALRAAVLGSVARAVVREARSSLVLVGPKVDGGWLLADRASIMVGTDGSDGALAAAFAAAGIARAIEASVELALVIPPVDNVRRGLPRRDRRAIADLAALRDAVRERGVHVDAWPLHGFNAASELVNRVRERGSSLIGVGSHGRSGVPRIVLGSVSEAVVRNASVPVIIAGPRWAHAW
jgi:nucleotide-binding universal stress UspA family protein